MPSSSGYSIPNPGGRLALGLAEPAGLLLPINGGIGTPDRCDLRPGRCKKGGFDLALEILQPTWPRYATRLVGGYCGKDHSQRENWYGCPARFTLHAGEETLSGRGARGGGDENESDALKQIV